MVRIGYHASHEQFAPSRLLSLVQRAEAAGFGEAKSSDHFHPWSERQGQSGNAWPWLGAALQATRFPIGVISAAGYRYHPAVLAQAAATLGEMYPERFWLALGSGEAINEAITGEVWPDKAERNARLAECVGVVRALFAGERVTHRGRVTVVEAKLYSRPATPVPIFGAAVTAETAAKAGEWADGLLIAGHEVEAVKPLVEAFRASAGGAPPIHLQLALSYAPSIADAEAQALDQWAPAAVGGEVNWDLRRPADFDQASRFVRGADMGKCVLVTDSLAQLQDRVAAVAELGIDVVQLHQVGANQEQFIDAMADLIDQVAAPGPRSSAGSE
jgi:coenzyme F420-dependent glucose-6-phosphate dehydrogenase